MKEEITQPSFYKWKLFNSLAIKFTTVKFKTVRGFATYTYRLMMMLANI